MLCEKYMLLDGRFEVPLRQKRSIFMSPAQDGPARFAIDIGASLITVQAFASGIASVVAHSPKFAMRDVSGDIRFEPEALQNSSLRISVRLGSLEIMDEVTSQDRREIERVMFDEVLEKSIYPTAQFQSSRVSGTKMGESMYRVSIAGELSFHGATRQLGFDSQLVGGEDTLRAQGTFSLLQSDFGMKIASVAGGTLKLKDDLRFAFFVIARRKN